MYRTIERSRAVKKKTRITYTDNIIARYTVFESSCMLLYVYKGGKINILYSPCSRGSFEVYIAKIGNGLHNILHECVLVNFL